MPPLAREIPGFYYDAERNRYFPLGATGAGPSSRPQPTPSNSTRGGSSSRGSSSARGSARRGSSALSRVSSSSSLSTHASSGTATTSGSVGSRRQSKKRKTRYPRNDERDAANESAGPSERTAIPIYSNFRSTVNSLRASRLYSSSYSRGYHATQCVHLPVNTLRS